MRQLLFLCLGASTLFSSPFAAADEVYACQHDGLKRTIKISYESTDSKIPCKVVYEKDSGTQILWSSHNEVGYCEAKAASFIARQRGWGWDCTKLAATVSGQ